MGYDTGIANRLRAKGLNVVEVAGWQTRGSSSFDPKGFIWHHTAGPAVGNSPSLNICIYGRAGLAGPLCNVFQARDNTVYVVAAGRANHAGTGGYRGLSGNSSVYGVEIENTGTGSEPWRLDQLEVSARIAAAVLGNAEMSCHHKEWTGRKIDMHSISGEAMRQATRNVSGAASPGPAPSNPVDLVGIANGIAEAKKHTLREGDRNDHVKWLQAGINQLSGRGLAVDGHFGPSTAQAVRDLETWFKLPVDGIAGPEVWALLFQAAAPAPAPTPAPDAGAAFIKALADKYGPRVRTGRTLKRGMSGNDVKDVQIVLNAIAGTGLAVDGSFGAGTENAVKNFQRFFKLGVDGVVGSNTRRVMADVASRVARG